MCACPSRASSMRRPSARASTRWPRSRPTPSSCKTRRRRCRPARRCSKQCPRFRPLRCPSAASTATGGCTASRAWRARPAVAPTSAAPTTKASRCCPPRASPARASATCCTKRWKPWTSRCGATGPATRRRPAKPLRWSARCATAATVRPTMSPKACRCWRHWSATRSTWCCPKARAWPTCRPRAADPRWSSTSRWRPHAWTTCWRSCTRTVWLPNARASARASAWKA